MSDEPHALLMAAGAVLACLMGVLAGCWMADRDAQRRRREERR